MFTSHKSDAEPRSRQSSMDLSVSGLTSTASTSESWSTQGVDDTPHAYNAMQTSPEQRHRAISSKRSSVFNFRSRSNTGASTTSIMSLSPAMSETDGSRPGTALTCHQNDQPGHHERSGSRKSLFRGKKGKRLSDSIPTNALVTDEQGREGGERRMSMLRRSRKGSPPEQPTQGLRFRISSPFGFQHLTHTNRQHMATFEQTSGDKLGAGFRTMPSSDRSEMNRTELHFSNFSSDNLVTQGSRSPSAMSFGSPPQSPRRHYDLQSSSIQQEPSVRPGLRMSRSVDSFSQPGLGLRNHRHSNSQSVLAPPRLSSLSPLPAIDDIPEESHPQTIRSASARRRSKRESGIWDTFSLATTPDDTHLSVSQDDSSYFGHALTTPDDVALPAVTPSFSPSLDDVAEEPERFVKPRRAPQPPMKGFTSPSAPYFDTSIFNNQRSPESKRRNRGDSHASPRTYHQGSSTSRPASQQSETLGSSDNFRRGSIRKPYAKRHESNTWQATEESWEDSIDYIYDHALEADCDFEWDRASEDATDYDDYRNSAQREQPRVSLQPPYESGTQHHSRDFRVSLLVPNVPDLVPTSATSVSTMGTGLTTPCTPYQGLSVSDVGGFMISPSLLVPPEYKEDQEDSYEDLLNSYEDSDRHFPMIDARYSATSSARSRRSSYDSSLMSSAQSSGMWNSPVRRSASSAGSVPDLVPSRRSRRDLGFSIVMDQMADSVTSLSHLDEEKEEESITPPGRPLANRTFFPAEDEPEEPLTHKTDLEGELRASLELARRGSQRSAQAPRHHKSARSDGAAKLLSAAPVAPAAQPLKQRSRAATTSHPRAPMLSLFPSPPRHSPRM